MEVSNSVISSNVATLRTNNWQSITNINLIKPLIILASGISGATLGYFWNKISDEWTSNYPGSGYNPEVDNPYGASKGIIIGASVGLLLSLSACNCCILSSYFFPENKINNETTPLLSDLSTSSSITEDITPSFSTVKISINETLVTNDQSAVTASKSTAINF